MQLTRTDILLTDLRFYAHHGVLEQERSIGAHFRVNLSLHLSPAHRAVEQDDLEGTINYAEVHALVRAEMAQPSQLLEHVGGRILRRCFEHFALLQEAEIEVVKEAPPIAGFDGADCRVRLSARR